MGPNLQNERARLKSVCLAPPFCPTGVPGVAAVEFAWVAAPFPRADLCDLETSISLFRRPGAGKQLSPDSGRLIMDRAGENRGFRSETPSRMTVCAKVYGLFDWRQRHHHQR